ncbi:MAG: TonB-dependent receptor [Cyclobacteriaceae bacterium]
MRKYYTCLYTCLLLFLASAAWAQQPVSGTVQDANGEVLIGVSVLEKGTTNGTITDIEGNFQVKPTGEDPTFIFSYIGYLTTEVAVGQQSTLEIVMQEDVAQLEEIVVIGFGTQKRVNLSGAVDQIDAQTLEDRPIANTAQGLQGMIPNLNIDFGSGEPGSAANINIRGITSINGGDPLILIDGVPSDPVELNRLAPQDIATVSVIKDASAAAIYGARAAFGVILINTKNGKTEGINISYSNFFSWNKPTVLPDKVTDPYIFSRLLETSTDNTPWDNVNYSDQYYDYARQRSNDPSVPGVRVNPTDDAAWEYMGNRDWTRYFMSDVTFSQQHALSIAGSSEKMQYYLSGAYNRQNGVIKIADDYFDRYNLRSKVNYQPAKWLSLGNNTYLVNTQRKTPSYLMEVDGNNNPYFSINQLYDFFPTYWDKNPDGTWANTPVGVMAAQITDGGQYTSNYLSLQTQFNAELSFWDDLLRVNTDFTYRRGATKDETYRTRYNIGYGPEDIREEGNNFAREGDLFENYTVLNTYATLHQQWGMHDLTAVVGYNQEYYQLDGLTAQRNQLISPAFPSVGLATGEIFLTDNATDWAIRGAFYRLNYILQDKYILEFNGRYDGSSRFPKDSRFGFFPSASAAWRIDQEAFLSNVNVISNLKLRASYGSLGNQSVGDYGYIPTLEAGASDYLIGGTLPQVVTPPFLVSPNYTWEKVSTLNVGLDLGLFEDQLSMTLDVYQRNTLGMLTLGRDLPDVLGAQEPEENAADLENKGWELSLNYRNNFNAGNSPLYFGARFVLSDSRAYITKFDNPNQNLTQYYEGMELGEIWGLKSDGLFQSEDEIEQLDETAIIPWGALSIVPGWPKYQDLDGNGAIEKGYTVDDPKDLSVIGNNMPRFRFGLDLNANWKGFDVRAFFQGVGKRDYYPIDYLYWGFYQQPYAGGYEHLLDFYRPTADSDVDLAKHSQAYVDAGLADQNLNAEYPILQAWLADRNLGTRVDESMGLAIPQTQYMLNGAYVRLKNLTVGYTLPVTLTDRLGIQSLRVFFSGENLMEWSPLKKFYDPEAINQNRLTNPSDSPDRTGNGYTYPWQRKYAFGLNVNF